MDRALTSKIKMFKDEHDKIPCKCCEKLCLELILKIANEYNENKVNSIKLEDCLSNIQNELKNENLWLDSYRNNFDSIKEKYKQGKLIESIEILDEFLNRKIRDLDFYEIINSILDSRNNLLKKIEKKKIILIIGMTGAGKSTVLHYLAGSEMIKGEDKCIRPNPNSISNQDLNNVISKFSMNSETKGVTPITIDYFDQDEEQNFTLNICDSPGFCDTNGPETDISNSVILKMAIDLSSAIKPVLLFNNNMGPRFQQLRDISNVLIKMVNNAEVNIKSMIFMFNQFDGMAPIEIKNKFAELKKEADNGRDENLKVLLNELCVRKVIRFYKIDLLDKEREKILKVLNDDELYQFIEKPSRVFKVSYSSDSEYKLEKQIEKHFDSIATCIKNNSDEIQFKKLNYALANYKVDELLEISEILKSDDLKRLIRSLSIRLIENSQKDLKDKVANLLDKLDNGEKIEGDSVVYDYIKAVHQSIHIDSILNKFLTTEEQIDNLFKFTIELKRRVISISELIKENSANIYEEYESIKLNLNTIKYLKNQINNNTEKSNEVLTSLRDSLNDIYKKTCDCLFKSVKIYIGQKSDDIIKTKNINQIVKDMDNINIFKNLDKDEIKLNTLYDELEEKLKKEFELNSDEATKLLFPENELLCEQDEVKINELYEKLNSIDEYFNSAIRNKRINEHVDIEKIKECYEKFKDSIGKFFTDLKKEFDEKIKTDAFHNLKEDFQIFFVFKKNFNFSLKISLIYNHLVDEIVSNINTLKVECVNFLNQILDTKTQPEARSRSKTNIIDSLKKLFSFKWFDAYKRNYVSNSIRFIEDKIEAQLNNLIFNALDLRVNLTEFSDLKELNVTIIKIVFLDDIFERINSPIINEPKINVLQRPQKLSPSLHDTIKAKKTFLRDKINNLLQEIQNHIDDNSLENFDYEYLEKSILFLETCESILNQNAFVINDAKETKRSILSFLNRRFDLLKKTVEDFFHITKGDSIETSKIGETKNKVDFVYNAIDECIQIVSKYDKCAINVDAVKCMNSWFDDLSLFYSSIERDLTSYFERPADYSNDIRILLELCRASIKFDKLILVRKQRPNNNFGVQSFDELYSQYSVELRRDTNLRYGLCEEFIRNGMFIELKNNLKHFRDRTNERNLQNLKIKLNETLIDLLKTKCIENLRKYLSQLDGTSDLNSDSSRRELERSLTKFNMAKTCLGNDIYLNIDSDELKEAEKNLINIFTSYTNDLKKQIEDARNRFDIEQSESKAKNLERTKFISVLLLDEKKFTENRENSTTNTGPSNNYSESKDEKVFSNIRTLEDLDLFDKIENNYNLLCEKVYLNDLKTVFESRVKEIFEQELELAVNNSNDFKTLDSNTHYKKCQNIAEKKLPIKLREKVINNLLVKSRNKIESNLVKNKLIENVSKSCSVNYDEYAKLLNDLYEKKDDPNIELLENIIHEQSKKLFQNFVIDLNNDLNPFKLIKENFEVEFYQNIYTKFGKFIPELNSILKQQYAPKINEFFEKLYTIIETDINNPAFEFRVIKDNFNFLVSFYELSKSKSELSDCFNIEKTIMKNFKKLFQSKIESINNNLKGIDLLNDFFNIIDKLKYNFKLSFLINDLEINKIFTITTSVNVVELKKLIESKLTSLLNVISSQNLIDDYRGKQLSDYEKFFDQFFSKLSNVRKVYDCFKEYILSSSIDSQYDNCIKKINSTMSDMYSNAKEYLKNMFNSKQDLLKIDEELFNSFQNCFYNLKSFKTKSSNILIDSSINLSNPNFEEEYRKTIMDQCENYLNGIELKNLDDSSIAFSNVKEIGLKFVLFKKSIDKKLQDSIMSWIKSNGGFKKVGDLGLKLTSFENGQIILEEHPEIFGSYERVLFNRKISDRDINIVMTELINKNGKEKINKEELLEFHKIHEKTFKDLIKRYKFVDSSTNSINLKPIMANISKHVNEIKYEKFDKRTEFVESVSNLTANLFALWALLIISNEINSLGLSSSDDINDDGCLFQPHPAQVLSIALMLNIGHKDSKSSNFKTLKNCLIQIGTGEGKSVTLSITAVILALIGYNVYCVCYSKYLSQRDYDSFYPLFKMLELTSNIEYGSFYEICEKMINRHGNLRDTADTFIKKGTIELKTNKDEDFQKRSNILLIDEVDVFFSQDFYGNYYLPALNLEHKCISDILDFIWKTYLEDKSKLNFEFIINSNQYKECCSVFKDWIKLIDSSILLILSDIKTFETIDHRVHDGKIGYIDNDTISFNIEYGYKTIFAYYLNEKLGEIKKTVLDKKKSFLIKLGTFSLAEIPKTDFEYILGVTGTLETLIQSNNVQKSIIENDYGIKSHIIMPSVYGSSKFVFNSKSEVYIENEENYHVKLIEKITECINSQRAVFVFFENLNDLNNFKNSEKYIYKLQTQVLTEETKDDEKKRLIQFAAESNKITLITKAFGRGTDFKVRDKKVKEEGLHVIQAFLSNEKSEEIQIKGRTARQGEKGTFGMVIYLKSLEKYNFFANDKQKLDPNEYYIELDKSRNKYFENSFKDTKDKVKNIKGKHDESTKLLKYLLENDKKQVKDYLINLNNYSNINPHSAKKILILIDATGSMANLLEKTRKTIEVMFARVFEILKSKNSDKSFEIKICVYRNYNSPIDEILQNSSWERMPEKLIQFLNSINAVGGFSDQINEAIELGLWQANREDNLSEVILLGDAPPNEPKQIENKRKLYRTKFKNTKFSIPTETFEELQILKKKGIKVNAFYLTDSAKEDFVKIAKATEGQHGFLDIDSPDSSKLLINLFCEQILTSFGDITLLEAYRTAYN